VREYRIRLTALGAAGAPTDAVAAGVPASALEEEAFALGADRTRCLFVTPEGFSDCRRADFPGVEWT